MSESKEEMTTTLAQRLREEAETEADEVSSVGAHVEEHSAETDVVASTESDDTKPSAKTTPEAELEERVIEDSEGATGADAEEDRVDPAPPTSFDMIKKGWEMYVSEQARNVHDPNHRDSFQPLQMLQNLNLCGAGEGLARITGGQSSGYLEEGDPFEPIVLRHTHSSPLQYSASMVDSDVEPIPPPIGLTQMRRSSSTPSSSAFRQRSEGSAFGTHLRAMPNLHGDRSAFSLPVRRSSFASLSDSGVRYSAFDPVTMPTGMMDEGEATSIEVVDLGPAETEEADDEKTQPSPSRRGAAARAAKFLRMRRSKRRSGREYPPGPTSDSSSSPKEDKPVKITASVDEGSISSNPSATADEHPKETIGISYSIARRSSFPTVQEVEDEDDGDAGDEKQSDAGQYQQLDSDVDEEYEHMQNIGIEASIQPESPFATPSPSYQQFVDEHVDSSEMGTDRQAVPSSPKLPNVRVEVANIASPPPQSNSFDGSDTTRSTQSPGTRSLSTNNTSGHTTLATSTSATVSSSHVSVLSTVSEADLEVMETNQAGKMRIRQEQKLSQKLAQGSAVRKGDVGSVTSASTTSTATHGYLALAGSPAPLREGASLPVDRFFGQTRIPVAHSMSLNSGSTSSSSAKSKKGGVGTGSPQTVSSSSMANNSSSSSADEEPPKFVSYLDRKSKPQTPVRSEVSVLPSVSERETTAATPPAEIVGYSEMVFEEAKMPGDGTTQHPTVIRPGQKADAPTEPCPRPYSRPPLSPAKGLRTPTTPLSEPPSPPRNIVDHRVIPDVSKPYALFRTGAGSSSESVSQQGVVLVSPEAAGREDDAAGSSGREPSPSESRPFDEANPVGDTVFTYSAGERGRVGLRESPISQNQTYEETNIEVKDKDSKLSGVGSNIVSPEKG